MSQFNKLSYIYNPANQSTQEIFENFVIRTKELNKIVRELNKTNLNIGAQHFLIEGQRGTGKTSLLLRLKYEIKNNKKLFTNLIPIQFAEEQYNIFDLCRLWESTADKLEDIEGFENLIDELEEVYDDDNYQDECFNIFERYLIKNNKRLVLLLDNFGDILDKFSDIEQKRLRDIFHTSKHIQLIATSSRALEHTYKHDKPFYEFFKIIKLDGLNKEDTISLLKQLAISTNTNIDNILENESNRIEVIRRLTGGIPRTIVLLFEIFQDNSANVFEDLEMILDKVTPLYKHRMDDLSTQQQAIIDAMALNWDGITSKEIVEKLNKRGFDTKKVSTHLINLEKNNIVNSKFIDKKNKIYLVKERFFNIWYLMRYGRRKNKNQVLWLVKFLEQWCKPEELETKILLHIQCAKEGTLHPKGGFYMAEALSSLTKDHELQHELLNETRNALIKRNPNIDKELSESDKILFDDAMIDIDNNNYKKAIKNLEKIKYKKSITYTILGALYDKKKSIQDSIKNYEIAIKKNEPEAMVQLAYIYFYKKEYAKTEKYLNLAVSKNYEKAKKALIHLYLNTTDIEKLRNSLEIFSKEKLVFATKQLTFLNYLENKNKKESLSLYMETKDYLINEKDFFLYFCDANLTLWNDLFKDSKNHIENFLEHYKTDVINDLLKQYFLLLLAKKQYNILFNLFEKFCELKDKFKPIYFALITIEKERYPKEYLKMGDELIETVMEILEKVEEKRKIYC